MEPRLNCESTIRRRLLYFHLSLSSANTLTLGGGSHNKTVLGTAHIRPTRFAERGKYVTCENESGSSSVIGNLASPRIAVDW